MAGVIPLLFFRVRNDISIAVFIMAVLTGAGRMTLEKRFADLARVESGRAGERVDIHFVVCGFPGGSYPGSRKCRVLILKQDDRTTFRCGELYFPARMNLQSGQLCSGIVEFKEGRAELLPGSDPAVLSSLYLGRCYAVIHRLHWSRETPVSAFFRRLESYSETLMPQFACEFFFSTVLNARQYESDLFSGFKALGLLPFLAISGLHFGILAMLVGAPAGKYRYPAVAVCGFCYLLFTGVPVSAMRAFLLIILCMYARFRGRKIVPLRLLVTAGLLQLLMCPGDACEKGFHLSYAAMLFLLPVMESRLHWKCMSVVRMQFALIPLQVLFFREYYPIMPVSSIVMGFPLTVLIAAGYILVPAFLLPERFIRTALLLYARGAEAVKFFVTSVAHKSIALNAGMLSAVLLCWIIWGFMKVRDRSRTALICLLLFLLFHLRPLLFSGIRLWDISCRNGSGCLVFQDGASALVGKNGTEAKGLLSGLKKCGFENVQGLDDEKQIYRMLEVLPVQKRLVLPVIPLCAIRDRATGKEVTH